MNFKRFFRTRWDVLEVMESGVWYFGFDLAKEHGFSRGTIHLKLCALEDDGFVKSKLVVEEYPGGFIGARRQYMRTGKIRPSRRVSFWTHKEPAPQM